MKQINKITIILVIFAVVFVGLLYIGSLSVEHEVSNEPYVSAYFDPDTVNTVKITISDDNWNDMLENPLEEEYHLCSIEINGDAYDGVGIRTKGNMSLSMVASSDSDRYSFKVKSDEYVKDQTFKGLTKFVLNNGIDDATYMKEYLSYQMMTELGVPTPLFSYAAVYINGEYYGLYLMLEAVEDDFAKRNFGADYGNLYKPETMRMGGSMPSGVGKMPGGFNGGDMAFPGDFGNMSEMMMPDGNPDEWMKGMNIPENFGDMAGEMNQGNADGKGLGMERPQGGNMPGGFGGSSGGADLVYTDDSLSSYSAIFDNAVFSRTDTKASEKRVITALKHLKEGTDLETYIDVDKVLRYFAANTAIVSLDSYVGSTTHNYYLYENNGKLAMIPWDYNDAIGFSTDASGAVNFPIDTPVGSGIELSNRPMIGSLLAVDSYKEVYHSYLRQIAEQFFADTTRIDKIDALINEYVKNDPTAFYTYEEYQNSLPQLKKFFELRAKSILGQLDGTIPSTREGQNTDKSALIPVDDLDFSALGSFSMGGRGNRGGDFMGDFTGEGFMEGFTGDWSEFIPESGFMPQTPF